MAHDDNSSESEPVEVTELLGSEGGQWAVETLRSRYLFDLELQTVTRAPGPTARLTVNDTTRSIRSIKSCEVGYRGYWIMETDKAEVAYYSQITSLIVKITRLPDNVEPGQSAIETSHVITGPDARDE
ncbi:hypothetical protein ACLRGF_05475 [Mycetocola zhadangensis]|uniref:hypothetical protein n=1 Tax=Mycetocola zhadangensis TaxID=1164595 RepID=UPI003A4D83C8